MTILTLHITSFGGLRNRTVELTDGVNLIEGKNESGKSSAAMFIKFMFYGLSSRSGKNAPSERQRYVNRDTGEASGDLTLRTDEGILYRLERTLTVSDDGPPRERIRIIRTDTGESITGEEPGEYFFGVPADVFVNTCFISQNAVLQPEITAAGRSGQAVENLLTTADENMDLHKAMSRLESMRRELLHRNGGGGEIATLKEKRESLLRELESGTQRTAEILSVSASLEDIKKKIDGLERSEGRYKGIFAALDKILVKRRIDGARQTEERMDALSASLAEKEARIAALEEALLPAEQDIRAYDEECAAFDEFTAQCDVSSAEEAPDSAEIGEAVRQADGSARTCLAVSVALLIAGVIGAGISVALYWFNTGLYHLPALVSAVLVVLGVGFMIQYGKNARRLNEILEEYDAESAEELMLFLSENALLRHQNNAVAEQRQQMLDALNESKLRFDAALDRINRLAAEEGLEESDDVYVTVEELHAVLEDAEATKKEEAEQISRFRGRLEVLREQLADVDEKRALSDAEEILKTEAGRTASAMTPEEIKAAARERAFTENALRSAMKRKSALEERLTELGKLSRTPDESASLLSALDERLEELSQRHEACQMAEEALKKAGEALRSGILPRIAERASGLLSAASPHDRILLDASWNCSVGSGEKILPKEHLSKGCADLAHVALRLALVPEIFGMEAPPTVLDETFAHVDPQRTRAFIKALPAGQYVIFSCHSEGDLSTRSL